MPRALAATGTLRGERETQLASNVSGRVVSVPIERGDRVKKGDLLARLDVRNAALSASEARASLSLAETRAQAEARECERLNRLLAEGAISQAEHDRQSDQCQVSRWNIAAASARVALTAQTVSDGTIIAPFDGVIAERFVDVGEYITPQTHLVTLVQPDPLRLEVTVPEAHIGDALTAQEVRFSVFGFKNEEFGATIVRHAPTIRRSSRDMVLEAVVPNPEGRLFPGMFATARLLLADESVPTVPVSALLEREHRHHVLVLRDNRIEERVVQIGMERDEYVAVLEGLLAGEMVVTNPQPELTNGQRVGEG